MGLGLPASPCRCSMSSQQLLWLLGPPCPDPCARTPRTVHLPACSGAASAPRASPWQWAPERRLLAVPPATRRVCAAGLETRLSAILMPAGSESYAGCAGVVGAATWISRGPHQHNFRGTHRQFQGPARRTPGRPPFTVWVEVRQREPWGATWVHRWTWTRTWQDGSCHCWRDSLG